MDGPSAVLMLECRDVDEAKQKLSKLPLVSAGLIDFDLIPLIPEIKAQERSAYMSFCTPLQSLKTCLPGDSFQRRLNVRSLKKSAERGTRTVTEEKTSNEKTDKELLLHHLLLLYQFENGFEIGRGIKPLFRAA